MDAHPPSIAERPPMRIAAMRGQACFNDCFFAPWGGDNERIAQSFGTQETYRLQIYEDKTPQCLTGACIAPGAPLPEGYMEILVPGASYAAFPCAPQGIAAAWIHAYDDWLPTSHCEIAAGSPALVKITREGECALYLPVRTAATAKPAPRV